MKVLITGASGFLGSYIVDLLMKRGYAVRSFTRSLPKNASKVEVYRGDIADTAAITKAVAGMDAVFHVAAKAGIWGDSQSYFSPNVLGTRNIIQACQKHGVKHLVYTSTPSVVFNGKALTGADESLPYGSNWLCHYAKTKALAEQEVLGANQLGGLKTIALRPHLIWGIGDQHLLPRILKQASTGKLRRIGEGKNLVDITHVKNAAQAHLLALEALQRNIGAGKPYFISQGEPVNLWSWIDLLLSKMNLPPVKKSIPASSAYALGACCEAIYSIFKLKQEPPMTRFLATELSKDHYFSINNAKKDLGYNPQVTAEEGLTELAKHLKA